MKLTAIATFLLISVLTSSAVQLPEVGSLDERFCAGGIVVGSSIIGSTDKEVIGFNIQCPDGFGNRTVPGSGTEIRSSTKKIASRQVNECDVGCELTCVSLEIHPNLSDCEEVAESLVAIESVAGISDTQLVPGHQLFGGQFGTCSMAFMNLMSSEESICRSGFVNLGLQVSEDCSPSFAGICTSTGAFEIEVLLGDGST